MPRAIRVRDMPVARATMAMPPRPTASASAAAQSRRVRSFSTGASASYFVRNVSNVHSYCVGYFALCPKGVTRWLSTYPSLAK